MEKPVREKRPDTNYTENLFEDEMSTSINVKIPNVGVGNMGNVHSESKVVTMPGSSTSGGNTGNKDLRQIDEANFMKINDNLMEQHDAFDEEPGGARVTLGFEYQPQSPTRISEKRKSTQPDEQEKTV